MKNYQKLLLLSAAFSFPAMPLGAAVLVQDSFSGTTVNNGGSGWFGFSNWNGTGAFGSNLTYGSLVTSGQSMVNTDRFGGVSREFPTLNSGNGTVWFSWLQNNSAAIDRNARVNIMKEGGNRFIIGHTANEVDNDFRIYDATGTSVATTGISTVGTHMVAGSLNLATGALNLYIDPTGLGSGAAPSSLVSASALLGALDIGQFSLATGDSTFVFDEVRIGNTWADVSPVPEPSSFALLGVGALGLAALRRRRSCQA